MKQEPRYRYTRRLARLAAMLRDHGVQPTAEILSAVVRWETAERARETAKAGRGR